MFKFPGLRYVVLRMLALQCVSECVNMGGILEKTAEDKVIILT